MTFQKALAFSLEREGGYVNDPNDPGGETNFGISKRAHPEVDIANLTEEKASEIYWTTYWEDTGGALSNGSQDAHAIDCTIKIRSSQMDALQAALFDFAIHSGNDRAITELQKLVGAAPDGRIGPQTRDAVSKRAFQLLALELCNSRKSFLFGLVRRNEKMQKFIDGWARRVALLEAALKRGQFDADDT